MALLLTSRVIVLDKVIHRKKSILQKISKVIAITSFIIAGIGMLFIMIVGSDLGDVYKASAGATTFIFFAMGLVFKTMADTNLPILKVPPTTDSK